MKDKKWHHELNIVLGFCVGIIINITILLANPYYFIHEEWVFLVLPLGLIGACYFINWGQDE